MSEIKEKRPRGRPVGSKGDTHRFNRSLAAYVRERLTPELYVEFQLAILQGHDAVLVPDERCSGGYRVEHREGGPIPGLEMRDRAMTNLRQAAWGLPAQQVQIDAQVRQQALIAVAGVDARALELGAQGRAELIAFLEQKMLASGSQGGGSSSAPEPEPEGGGSSSEPDAEDAEYSDVTEPEGG